MLRGVQKHYAPRAVCIFQHVYARIILLNLPKVRHIQSQQIADNRLVHRVMRSDKHCFALILGCIFVEGSACASAHVLKAFAAVRHLHLLRLGMPERKLCRIALGDIACEHSLPAAVVDFGEPFVRSYRQAVQVSAEAAGLVGALQRAGDAQVDWDCAQRLGQQQALLASALAERSILLPLIAAFDVPGGFAVSY